MKKSVCLLALLGAFGASANAASTQSVEVTFEGYVTDKTCDITLSNGSNSVDLGSILTTQKESEPGTRVPVIFKLSNCNGLTLDTAGNGPIDLAQDLTPTNVQNSNINEGTLATDKTHVVVQFYQNAGGTTPGLLPNQTVDTSDNVHYINVGWAALKRKGAEALTPSAVNAKALFTVSYQ